MATKKGATAGRAKAKRAVSKQAVARKSAAKTPAAKTPAAKTPGKKTPAVKKPAAKPASAKSPATRTGASAPRASGNKTIPTDASVERYLATIANPARRADCEALCALMARASGYPPQMWGTAIVGFGRYHYRYDSGREGDSMLVGFSSRASEIAIYGLRAAPRAAALLGKLGKHKEATACVYVKAMADVDTAVLAELVATAAVAKKKEDIGA